MLGVAERTISNWQKEGRISCGRRFQRPSDGRAWVLYPIAELEPLVGTLRDGPPLVLEANGAGDYRAPAGFVDVHGACAMLGVGRSKLTKLQKQDRIPGVRWARYPEADKPGARRVYPVEELRGLVNPLLSAETFPPPGWVDGAGAAALLGISVGVMYEWMRNGRLSCPGELVNGPNGKRGRIWPVAELEQAREAAAKPDGWVTTEEAVALFDVSSNTWSRWLRAGILPAGRPGRVERAGSGGRCLLYPLEELLRIKEKMEQERRLEPYPDPKLPGVWRVPLASHKNKGMEALIDEGDLPLAQGKRWNWSGGHASGTGASVCRPGGGSLPRLIVGAADDREQLVCYVNGNGLDCRRENLVVRTRSEVRLAARRPEKWDRVAPPYPDPERPGVVRVPLCSEKHPGMEVLIDADALPLVAGKRLNWAPGSRGREGEGAVILVNDRIDRPQLHQVVMGVRGIEYRVGHRNGDPLDCRRENLVVRTNSQQKAASRKVRGRAGRPCSSRFKGVHFNLDGHKWSATIAIGGKVRGLGRFLSEIDAALAYDAAAWELYGEHARLNFADAEEAERLRAEQPPAEPGTFPPPGMVDADGAAQMFGFPAVMWTAWERVGRMPVRGDTFPIPGGGECVLYRAEDLNRIQKQIRQLANPYPDPACGGRFRVPLRGFLCYREAIIDAESLPQVEGRNWQWQERSDGIGTGAVVQTDRDHFGTPLARVLAQVTEAGFDTRVSHRNGDPLDCRLANILVRTMQQQLFGNRKLGTVNGRKYTSRFKGVSWDKRRERWLANITLDGKMRRLGSFRDEIAAAQTYDEAARELFGEFARVNFPDGVDVFLASEYAGESGRAAA